MTITQVFAIIAVLVLSASIGINLYRIAYRRARRSYKSRSHAQAPITVRIAAPSPPVPAEPPKRRKTVIGIAAKI